MKIEDVKVISYLNPDPLDEFCDLESADLACLPGFLNKEDEEDGLPPRYSDYNINIYRDIEAKIEDHFKIALQELWPLLEKCQFRSINISIDYFGFLAGNSYGASYIYGRSNQISGVYNFNLHCGLFYNLIKKLTNDTPLDEFDRCIWQHELIHLLDQQNIISASLYKNSSSKNENLKYYFTKYREEGIAELFYLLKGNKAIENIEIAKKLFLDEILTISKNGILEQISTEKERNELYNGHSFYKIGPWLILDLLKTCIFGDYLDIVYEALDRLEKGEEILIETILEIIRYALMIDVSSFLEYIDKEYCSKNQLIIVI